MSDLTQFVLGYIEECGGLVEEMAPAVYTALLPEEVAAHWHTSPYLPLTFNDPPPPDTVRLGYNHPLVEKLVQEAVYRPTSTQLYINNLRLDKTGLAELAAQQWVVLNGRTLPAKRATVARVRYTYIRFNFKVAIVTEEKQEQLVSVLLDAHGGQRVAQAEGIVRRATAVTPDQVLSSLPHAPIRWQAGLTDPLSLPALTGLLQRTETAVQQEIAPQLEQLQQRITRFRQLDEARLAEYYDDLETDLQQRLTTSPPDRQASLQEKLQAIQAERGHKLADVAERYQIKISLTLLNLMVIQQAKLVTAVSLENRSGQIPAYAVWDPLLHQLEPPICDVCGQPGQRVYLCHNGHIAHEECLAPACIDCKRVFCRLCAHEVGECQVCHKPLCRHSRIVCPTCQRGTCQAHKGLCHAHEGQPVDLTPPPPAPPPEPPATPPPPAAAPTKKKPTAPTPSKKVIKPVAAAPAQSIGPKPQRIEVVTERSGTVVAFVLTAKERIVARRQWHLEPEQGGIICSCTCEKASCAADNIIHRPAENQRIERQLLAEIISLSQEYGLSTSKIHYNQVSMLDGSYISVPALRLAGMWKDVAAIEQAQQVFANLYRKK